MQSCVCTMLFFFLSTGEPRRQLYKHSQLAAVSYICSKSITPRQRVDRVSYLQPLIQDDIPDFWELGETRIFHSKFEALRDRTKP